MLRLVGAGELQSGLKNASDVVRCCNSVCFFFLKCQKVPLDGARAFLVHVPVCQPLHPRHPKVTNPNHPPRYSCFRSVA